MISIGAIRMRERGNWPKSCMKCFHQWNQSNVYRTWLQIHHFWVSVQFFHARPQGLVRFHLKLWIIIWLVKFLLLLLLLLRYSLIECFIILVYRNICLFQLFFLQSAWQSSWYIAIFENFEILFRQYCTLLGGTSGGSRIGTPLKIRKNVKKGIYPWNWKIFEIPKFGTIFGYISRKKLNIFKNFKISQNGALGPPLSVIYSYQK